MNSLTLLDARDTVIGRAESEGAVALTVERAYQPGDRLVMRSDEKACYASVSALLSPAYLYLPGGEAVFHIPTEPESLRAYAPLAFRGLLHTFTLAPAPLSAAVYRNLALNPLCQREFAGAYPFVSANVETRDESVFFARNVIDGCTQNNSHGDWPYQSWGIGLSEKAEITLEFGREVEVDRMMLTLRADFPHDAYWKQATVRLSDGWEQTFPLEKSARAQVVDFGESHRITSLTLTKLVKEVMESPFPALTEWEVWGRG